MKLLKALSLILAALTLLSSVNLTSFAEDEAAAAMPILTVDMSAQKHEIVHGAAGFLYGVSNEGVPSVNTLTALKPKVLATKGALGTEHPYGDALDVADEFFEGGGEMVMMYNSNYYGVFGVTASAEDYAEVLRTIIAPYVAEWKDSMREKYPDIDKRIVYIPINEGTPANLADGTYDFHKAWELYYNAINEGERAYYAEHGLYDQSVYEKTAYIAGPNDANYRGYDDTFRFLLYCRKRNCLPDVMTWHELDERDLVDMLDHKATYYQACRELDIEPMQVVCNEYAPMKDCGVPGKLVNWIARFEDAELYGCLPFWHQANNLNDLTADDNSGNGAWWVYKWYSDMSGYTLNVTSTDEYNGFYGVATIDDAKKSAAVLAGGVSGNAKVVLENLDETETFKDSQRVNVSVQAAYFEGYHGSVYEPATVFEGTYAVKDGKIEIDLANIEFSTGYYITVTPTDDSESEPVNAGYRAVYEAEEAELLGDAMIEQMTELTISYYLSDEARVANLCDENDGVLYTIDVPVDGRYELCFLYGNGVGLDRGNQNHEPKNLSMNIEIDSGKKETLKLESTLFYGMEDSVKVYKDLTAGKHTILVSCDGKEKKYYPKQEVAVQLYLDALYVSYAGAFGEEVATLKKYEAEAADFNRLGEDGDTKAVTDTKATGYSGSGYVMGLNERSVSSGGGIRWIVNVVDSGNYDLTFKYQSNTSGKINVYKDNTSITLDKLLTSATIEATNNEWKETSVTVYLAKGINIIDIDTDVDAFVDCMYVDVSDVENSVTVEAESGSGTFDVKYSEFAEADYVEGIIAEADEAKRDEKGRYLEIKVNVSEAGLYNMQVFQSNDDLCGTHWYNIKVIDKYAVVSVNGDEGTRYFFANTFSNDTFRERSVTVSLNAGENTIRFYNDDSWEVYYGGSTSEPGTDRLTNYMPNFDKFVFTPVVSKNESTRNEHVINVRTTYGGYVLADKNTVVNGESVTLTVIELSGEQGGKAKFNSLYVNGEKLSPTQNEDGTYSVTIENVSDDLNVKAEFELSEWLNEAIESAKTRLKYDYCYTEASIRELETALENAKKVAKNGTQTAIYQSYFTLCEKINALNVKFDNLFEGDYIGYWGFEDNTESDTGITLELVGTRLEKDLWSIKYDNSDNGTRGVKFDQNYGLALGEFDGDFTLSIRANVSSRNKSAALFFKNMGDASNQKYCNISFENGHSRVNIHNGADIMWKNAIYSHRYTVDQWHCYTYTEKDGIGTLYIDGENIASGIIMTDDEKSKIFLGTTYWNEHLMNGIADDLYIYDKALTDDEVALLASGTKPSIAKTNKNELAELIVKASLLDMDYYNSEQESQIKSALSNGESVYKKELSTQDEIDGAVKELSSVLKLKGEYSPKKNSGNLPVIIAACIAVAAVVAIIIVITKKAKKKA